MITASFSCFKGLSNSAEQKIWQLGCLSWDRVSFLPYGTFSKKKTEIITLEIKKAQKALQAGLVDYFLNRFKSADKVRVLAEFQEQTAVLDIETTGLSRKDAVTTIAILKNGLIHVFINGIDFEDFFMMLKDVKLLITFNGSRFDLPFLRRLFPIDLNIPHLDMMLVLNGLGFKGGQKKCEVLARIKRKYSQGVSGDNAVFLWNRWKNVNDFNALKQLVLYNAEDVFMLEKLAVKAYNLVMKTYPMQVSLKSSINDESLTSDKIRCSLTI